MMPEITDKNGRELNSEQYAQLLANYGYDKENYCRIADLAMEHADGNRWLMLQQLAEYHHLAYGTKGQLTYRNAWSPMEWHCWISWMVLGDNLYLLVSELPNNGGCSITDGMDGIIAQLWPDLIKDFHATGHLTILEHYRPCDSHPDREESLRLVHFSEQGRTFEPTDISRLKDGSLLDWDKVGRHLFNHLPAADSMWPQLNPVMTYDSKMDPDPYAVSLEPELDRLNEIAAQKEYELIAKMEELKRKDYEEINKKIQKAW